MEISTGESSEFTSKKSNFRSESKDRDATSQDGKQRPGASGVDAEPSVHGDDLSAHASRLEGLPLEEYAARNGLTESEVWKRLRQGDLVGRTHRGKLIIFSQPDFEPSASERDEDELAAYSFDEPGSDSADSLKSLDPAAERLKDDLTDLPPLPGEQARQSAATSPQPLAPHGLMPLEGQRTSSPEIALLLDHLSLAKEENREILRMTQESIRKVTELTESLVDMKDAVIDAKDAQIQALKEQLKASDRQNAKLKQDNEDLQMLARSLAES